MSWSTPSSLDQAADAHTRLETGHQRQDRARRHHLTPRSTTTWWLRDGTHRRRRRRRLAPTAGHRLHRARREVSTLRRPAARLPPADRAPPHPWHQPLDLRRGGRGRPTASVPLARRGISGSLTAREVGCLTELPGVGASIFNRARLRRRRIAATGGSLGAGSERCSRSCCWPAVTTSQVVWIQLQAVPAILRWVVAAPGAAVARQALLQAVAGPRCKPSMACWRIDLQPDPGEASGVRPRRQGPDTAQRDAATWRSSGRTQ